MSQLVLSLLQNLEEVGGSDANKEMDLSKQAK